MLNNGGRTLRKCGDRKSFVFLVNLSVVRTMVDEQSCIQEVQNLIRTFRSSDRHRWLEIFLKTEEYLQ